MSYSLDGKEGSGFRALIYELILLIFYYFLCWFVRSWSIDRIRSHGSVAGFVYDSYPSFSPINSKGLWGGGSGDRILRSCSSRCFLILWRSLSGRKSIVRFCQNQACRISSVWGDSIDFNARNPTS
jgi:hypothetical protein